MVDVRSGAMVSPATVVVRDGLIAAVNPASAPSDAQVIDLGDVTLLPGFMDMHVHILMTDGANYRTDLVGAPASEVSLHAAVNAKKLLLAGFTTVRDLGQLNLTPELIAVSLAKAVDAGWVDGPRIVSSGHPISITGGHIDPEMHVRLVPGLFASGPEYGVVDGVDEAVKATRMQIKRGARVIKIAATAGVMSVEDSVGGAATVGRRDEGGG